MNKGLKFVVIFIISVCFGGVLVVIMLPKTFNFKHELVINQPIDYCWNLYNNDSMRAEWITNLDELTYVEGKSGEEGAKRNVFYKEDTNSRVKVVETILELDSPFHYKYSQEVKPLLFMTTEVRFVAKDSFSTVLTSKLDAKATNRLFKLFMFGTKKGIKKQTGEDLEKLKQLMEKGGLEAFRKENPLPIQ
jgi:hypothetical protein